MTLLTRLQGSLREVGFAATAAKMARYPLNQARRRYWRHVFQNRILASGDPERIFTEIYRGNLWGSPESRSGPGSSHENTAHLAPGLAEAFARLEVKTLLDAPCGDFHWMAQQLPALGLRYLGADIVPELIETLRKTHGRESVGFEVLDITKGPLPRADLMLCRDCLFHLSEADIERFFAVFAASEIPFLMTTSHETEPGFVNEDIRTGDWRRLDLTKEPFALPEACVLSIDDTGAGRWPRALKVWRRVEIHEALTRWRAAR